MIVLTPPWHYVGVLGMPRRTAFFDYTDPALAGQALFVLASVVGGAVLVVSVGLVPGGTGPWPARAVSSRENTASVSGCTSRTESLSPIL